MQKYLIFIFIIILCNTVFGDQLILKNGEEIYTSLKQFDKDLFWLMDGEKINRSEVREIVFIEPSDYLKENPEYLLNIDDIYSELLEFQVKYSDAGGIIILDKGEDILNEDGTRIYRYHFVGKILKPDNLEWGENSLYFEEGRSKVKILGARTVKQDKSIRKLEESMLKVASPVEGMLHMGREKYLSFSLPDVQVGDIIEYVYQRDYYNPYDRKIFEPSYYFQSSEPTIASIFTVRIPQDNELNYFTRNIPASYSKPITTAKNGVRIYRWELRDIPPLIEEDYMPGYIDVAPGVYSSVFKEWDYLFDWESSMNLRRMEVTPEIKNLVQELTGEVDNIQEKIAILYHWVQRNIRYVSIKGGIASGMCGHPANTTLENMFGDCIDKSTLFSTMLKVTGVEAYPVGLLTNDDGTPPWEVPNIYCNHAITEVHLGDSVFYLDPTSFNHRYPYYNGNDHGTLVMNSILRTINQTPVPPPSSNMRQYDIHAVMDTSGDAIVTFSSYYTGDWESWIRSFWQDIPKSEWEDQINKMITEDYPDAVLIEHGVEDPDDLTQQFGLSWKYKLRKFPLSAKDLIVFKIPDLREYNFGEVAYNARNFDIVYETSYSVRQNAILEFPDGFDIAYLPEQLKLECPYSQYEARYTMEGNKIIFTDLYERSQRVIPVKDYSEYKEFLDRIANYSLNKIILKRK